MIFNVDLGVFGIFMCIYQSSCYVGGGGGRGLISWWIK